MVKEKPNSTRTYDEEGFRRRAACLCVRDHEEKEVLMVYIFKLLEVFLNFSIIIDTTRDQ